MSRKDKDKEVEYRRKYYAEHRDVLLARAIKWNIEHKEITAERARKWKSEHKDRVAECRHKRYQVHKLKHRADCHNYNINHRAEIVARKHNRRALKKGTTFNLTPDVVQEILTAGCLFKDKTCAGPLTVAHDIPVSRNGNTTRSNVFCLCLSHNSRMYNKTLAELVSQLKLF